MQLPELRTSLQTTSRDCLQLLGALEQHKHQYPGSGSAEKKKAKNTSMLWDCRMERADFQGCVPESLGDPGWQLGDACCCTAWPCSTNPESSFSCPQSRGIGVLSALSGTGCIWWATQHPPDPPAVAPAVLSWLELHMPSYTPCLAQHFSAHQGRHKVCIFFFLSKLLTLGQQLAVLFMMLQCEGQEWGRFAFQESHFFPMKSMHYPNTQSMFSTADK